MRIPGGEEEGNDVYTAPQRGHPPSFYWPANSRLVADHISAGNFDTAARILEETVGAVQLGPFKTLFLSIYAKFDFLHFNLSNS